VDSADFGRGDDDRIGPGFPQPGMDIGLVSQVERAPVGGRQLAFFAAQTAQQGRADHASMAADPDSPALNREMLATHRRLALAVNTFDASYTEIAYAALSCISFAKLTTSR
jgi:hypothetical protein